VIVPLDLLLFVILVITAVLALSTRNLLTAVALLTAYSLFAALLFAGLSAVDVALVEAALGAGLTGVLFIAAILATTRHSEPRPALRRRSVVAPLILAFLGLMLYASSGLPDRGDPNAPAQLGIGRVFLSNSLAETETPNVVTALLADYRSMDTLGETLVILTAALAAALVLMRREPSAGSPSDGDRGIGSPTDPGRGQPHDADEHEPTGDEPNGGAPDVVRLPEDVVDPGTDDGGETR
jgi:multicomponent Na+:H+ antiporter subunit B